MGFTVGSRSLVIARGREKETSGATVTFGGLGIQQPCPRCQVQLCQPMDFHVGQKADEFALTGPAA
jgi:hypothetical protein